MYIISPKGIKEEARNQSNLKGTYIIFASIMYTKFSFAANKL
jgi:hypothetical protein